MTVTDRIVPSSNVFSTEIGNEAVVLNQLTGTYYGLDEVAAEAWKRFASDVSLGDVHSALLAEFDVDADLLWADLVELVARLTDLGLITVVSSPSE